MRTINQTMGPLFCQSIVRSKHNFSTKQVAVLESATPGLPLSSLKRPCCDTNGQRTAVPKIDIPTHITERCWCFRGRMIAVFPRPDDSGVAAAGSVGKEAVGDGLQEHGHGGGAPVMCGWHQFW